MKEIKEEDRIIAKILRGELAVDKIDFENLSSANLTKKQEQVFVNLADEIKELAKQNEEERDKIEERIDKAEKHRYTKIELSVIESEIRDKKEQIKSLNSNILKLIIGMLSATVILMLASSFVLAGSILGGVIAMFSVGVLGTASMLLAAKLKTKKIKAIKQKIAEHESDRLEIIEAENLKTIESNAEVVRKKNLINRIYEAKDIELTEEEQSQIGLWF